MDVVRRDNENRLKRRAKLTDKRMLYTAESDEEKEQDSCYGLRGGTCQTEELLRTEEDVIRCNKSNIFDLPKVDGKAGKRFYKVSTINSEELITDHVLTARLTKEKINRRFRMK